MSSTTSGGLECPFRDELIARIKVLARHSRRTVLKHTIKSGIGKTELNLESEGGKETLLAALFIANLNPLCFSPLGRWNVRIVIDRL
jgi:hypothetical protein